MIPTLSTVQSFFVDYVDNLTICIFFLIKISTVNVFSIEMDYVLQQAPNDDLKNQPF